MSAVMAVLDFHGDSAELAARYDKAVHDVVAVSSARPLLHLAVPREYGFMVVDVWTSEEVLRAFVESDEIRRVLREAGMPEPRLRVYPAESVRRASSSADRSSGKLRHRFRAPEVLSASRYAWSSKK